MPKQHPGQRADLADVSTVGIPRALLYHRYGALWRAFFEALGRTVMVSRPTDRAVLEAGQAASVDETCLASKVYMGHVRALMDADPAPDAIFVPSMLSQGLLRMYCTKFQALPDLVANTFSEERPRLLSLRVDEPGGCPEQDAYLDLAARMGATRKEAKAAWKAAARAQREHEDKLARAQAELVASQAKLPAAARPLTILVASHPYVLHDAFVGGPVIDTLRELGATVLFADETDRARAYKESLRFSQTMPWAVNREVVGSILLLHEHVDGIVLMSAFPCGPDSMTDDAVSRCIHGKPLLTLTVDAQSGTAGLETRTESFVDILSYQRKGGYLHE